MRSYLIGMAHYRCAAGKHNSAGFFPFSYGPRKCVGKNLASTRLRMLLCWMLRRFRFSESLGVSLEWWEEMYSGWIVVVHQDFSGLAMVFAVGRGPD